MTASPPRARSNSDFFTIPGPVVTGQHIPVITNYPSELPRGWIIHGLMADWLYLIHEALRYDYHMAYVYPGQVVTVLHDERCKPRDHLHLHLLLHLHRLGIASTTM